MNTEEKINALEKRIETLEKQVQSINKRLEPENLSHAMSKQMAIEMTRAGIH